MTVRLTHRRWLSALTALALAASLLAIAVPANAADETVDCTDIGYTPGDVQDVLDIGAVAGFTLTIIGQCPEAIAIPAYDLTIVGFNADPALDGFTGDGTTSTVTVAASNVTITDLGISGGVALVGAGINNSGNLTLNNVNVNGNDATGPDATPDGTGGGIFNGGSLTLNNSTVTGNSADFGGGIQNNLTASINGSTFTGNTALAGGAVNNGQLATITGSTLSTNSADQGGAIFNQGNLTVSGGTVDGNTATDSGGAIYNLAGTATTTGTTTISNNSAPIGGALFNVTVANIGGATFASNSATTGNGGAINNQGTLTTDASTTFDANSAVSGAGGAIYNAGTSVTVTGSTLGLNSAETGGAIHSDGGSVTIDGGATLSANTAVSAVVTESTSGGGIFIANSSLTIGTATLSANTADGPVADSDASHNGGGIYAFNGTVTLNGTTLSGNTAEGEAGGVFIDPTSTLDADNSTFTSNGALTATDALGTPIPSDGGAIHNLGTATIDGSTFTTNTTADGVGGALYNAGTVTVGTSIFTGNTVAKIGPDDVAGGAVYNIGDITIDQSLFDGNDATAGFGGGAVYNIVDPAATGTSGLATVINSTFVNNTGDRGAAINNNNGATAEVRYSTITLNDAGTAVVPSGVGGGGIWNAPASSFTLTGTIVAENTHTLTPDCHGVITSGGYNLIGTLTAAGNCTFAPTTGDQSPTPGGASIDPLLGALADNGGATLTRLPNPGSPVIDAGPVDCGLSVDQRDVARPIDGACDTGSVETGTDDPPVAVDDTGTVASVGGSTVISVTNNDIEPDGQPLSNVTITTPPTYGTAVVSGLDVTYTHDGSPNLSDTFAYTVSDGTNTSNAATVSITIAPPNLPPVAVDDAATVIVQQDVVIDVTANDSDPENDPLSNVTIVSPPSNGEATVIGLTVVYSHGSEDVVDDSFAYTVSDGTSTSNVAVVTITAQAPSPEPHTVGLVNPNSGEWHLRAANGAVTNFFYGNPGDIPVVGDWDGDGIETVGMYRQSNGFVYLRNSNVTGPGEIQFTLGIAGDIPLAGDFNGDGKDTISVYRPSQGRVFIANTLGANNGFFIADYDYYFGDPGDKPFVGDFNGDGIETVGLYRDTTGFVYFTDAVTPGAVAPTNNQFFYGDPSDRLVSGDWTGDGIYTMAIFRPSDQAFYLRYSNTQGFADETFAFGQAPWLPVAGYMGL